MHLQIRRKPLSSAQPLRQRAKQVPACHVPCNIRSLYHWHWCLYLSHADVVGECSEWCVSGVQSWSKKCRWSECQSCDECSGEYFLLWELSPCCRCKLCIVSKISLTISAEAIVIYVRLWCTCRSGANNCCHHDRFYNDHDPAYNQQRRSMFPISCASLYCDASDNTSRVCN